MSRLASLAAEQDLPDWDSPIKRKTFGSGALKSLQFSETPSPPSSAVRTSSKATPNREIVLASRGGVLDPFRKVAICAVAFNEMLSMTDISVSVSLSTAFKFCRQFKKCKSNSHEEHNKEPTWMQSRNDFGSSSRLACIVAASVSNGEDVEQNSVWRAEGWWTFWAKLTGKIWKPSIPIVRISNISIEQSIKQAFFFSCSRLWLSISNYLHGIFISQQIPMYRYSRNLLCKL